MRMRPALKLNRLFMIHNLYLTIVSGSLLALFIEQVAPTIWRRGIFFAICNHQGGWTNELVILYYVRDIYKVQLTDPQLIDAQLNYLTKYVEFIDTIFLVLKKKPLSESVRNMGLCETRLDSDDGQSANLTAA